MSAARLDLIWSSCQTACSVTPRTSLGAPRQAQSASHAQILQNTSHRERPNTPAREMGMEWECNRARDGMGVEWQGGLTGLAPPHPATSQRAGVAGSFQRQLWAAARPCEQARLCLGNSTWDCAGERKTAPSNQQQKNSRKGGLCGAPSSWPPTSSHRSHHRGDLASRSEPRALGRMGGLCGAPSPWPPAASHRSHRRGDLTSSREPRALGRAGK